MILNRAHHTQQERLVGPITVRAADWFHADDFDTSNDEHPIRSAGTIDLAVKVFRRDGQLVGDHYASALRTRALSHCRISIYPDRRQTRPALVVHGVSNHHDHIEELAS